MTGRGGSRSRAHPGAPTTRIPVAVLGATGAVGQNFIRLLADHPWFQLAELAASERSAGKRYEDAARWIGGGPIPEAVRGQVVVACEPAQVRAPIVFSALDADVAGGIELAFATAGRMVLSNAKNFRMDDDVPLVIPEVNADHLALLEVQRAKRGWSGGIVTNANCASIMAVMALAPLHEAFGINRLFVATMQAVSGAGYPGVPSLDILGNVIPYIKDEEAKIEVEICKMLGRRGDTRIEPADITISAHANRVPVENGHTVCLSVDFLQHVSASAALDVLREWRGDASGGGEPDHGPRRTWCAQQIVRANTNRLAALAPQRLQAGRNQRHIRVEIEARIDRIETQCAIDAGKRVLQLRMRDVEAHFSQQRVHFLADQALLTGAVRARLCPHLGQNVILHVEIIGGGRKLAAGVFIPRAADVDLRHDRHCQCQRALVEQFTLGIDQSLARRILEQPQQIPACLRAVRVDGSLF